MNETEGQAEESTTAKGPRAKCNRFQLATSSIALPKLPKTNLPLAGCEIIIQARFNLHMHSRRALGGKITRVRTAGMCGARSLLVGLRRRVAIIMLEPDQQGRGRPSRSLALSEQTTVRLLWTVYFCLKCVITSAN